MRIYDFKVRTLDGNRKNAPVKKSQVRLFMYGYLLSAKNLL